MKSLFFTGVAAFAVSTAAATDYYWSTNDTTSWSENREYWSENVDGSGTLTGWTAGINDGTNTAIFSADGYTDAKTITLYSDAKTQGLVFRNGSHTKITGGNTSAQVTVGTDGITTEVTAVASIGYYSAMNVGLTSSQTWTLNSTGSFAINPTSSGSYTIHSLATSGVTTLSIAGTGSGGASLNAPLIDGDSGSILALTTSRNVSLGKLNTYTGDTLINAGTLTLSNSGGLTFAIGADGVNNSISGTGSAALNGSFTFDLTEADTVGTWNIVDTSSLSTTFGGTFSVNGFSESAAGIWESGTGYTFSEITGELTAIPEPASFALLTAGVVACLTLHRRRQHSA
ncbi:hypothetical protein SH580_05895 [Coraliomargarita algicola]|uniref:PEP-CTERM protein-sorting domain-containing protein n=1 Tax=Coraliomargarita algicola TaxID=3092156 RepID=A0ABZ0RQ49_9BACT|nr:hypothetical protein [Coraliomargarita sp. J2-16]WPJ97238.1 hypothetical protein SH580_05895 [Coraliomargarita sp. J2-16]